MANVTLKSTVNDFNTYVNNAATGVVNGEVLKDQKKNLQKNIDTLVRSGDITQDQHKRMTSDLDAMGETAGASNGADRFNKAVEEMGKELDGMTTVVANTSGNMQIDGKLNPTSVAVLNQLKGDGNNAFSKFLGQKYGIDVHQSPTKIAEEMVSKGMYLMNDAKGNAIVYDPKSRSGGGFDANGGSVSTPNAFWDKGSKTQAGQYSFDVGDLKATFGGEKDDKGYTYGLKVDEKKA